MGTDIHGIFQAKTARGWEDVPSDYDERRHYQLFAVLAGVRNGTGFAGVVTGDPVVPISEPRGLPEDFLVGDDDHHPITLVTALAPFRREFHLKHPEESKAGHWMGDHDHSWLTGEEMLAWLETAPILTQRGVVTRAVYDAWDGNGRPSAYCGDVFGKNVITVDDDSFAMLAHPDWTHVGVTWQRSLREELGYFFDEVKRLVDQHGQIRYVFGFDS